MELSKYVYFDDGAATSWVNHSVGKELANKLSKDYGYLIVDYNGIVSIVKNAVKSDTARNHAIVFANDVVPYELFSDDIDPMNSLLMRFIAKGGTIVWIGDVPFWYRTGQGNKVDRESIFNKLLPFKALGVFTVFTESPKTASTICVGGKCATWISRRPIIYPGDVEAVMLRECKDRIGDSHIHKYIYPLTKTLTIVSGLYPLPKGEIELTIRKLRLKWWERIKRLIGKAKVGIGIESASIELEAHKPEEFEKKISSKALYWEATPAWIKCFGRGHFIRLFDEPWNPDTISGKDIEDRAFVINHYVEEVSRIKR